MERQGKRTRIDTLLILVTVLVYFSACLWQLSRRITSTAARLTKCSSTSRLFHYEFRAKSLPRSVRGVGSGPTYVIPSTSPGSSAVTLRSWSAVLPGEPPQFWSPLWSAVPSSGVLPPQHPGPCLSSSPVSRGSRLSCSPVGPPSWSRVPLRSPPGSCSALPHPLSHSTGARDG